MFNTVTGEKSCGMAGDGRTNCRPIVSAGPTEKPLGASEQAKEMVRAVFENWPRQGGHKERVG